MCTILLAPLRAASPWPAVLARGTAPGTPEMCTILLAPLRAASPWPAVLARGALRFPGGKPPGPKAGTPEMRNARYIRRHPADGGAFSGRTAAVQARGRGRAHP